MDTEASKEPSRHGGNVFTVFLTSLCAAIVVAGGFGIVHTDTSDEGTRISAGRLRNSVVEMVKQRFPEAPELSVSMRMAAFPATAESVEDMLLQVGPDEAQEGAAAA